MISLSVFLFVFGLIMIVFGSMQIGKKQYKITFEKDVEEIINKAVNDFLIKNTKTICNHIWEDKSTIDLYRKGESKENSLPTSKIYIQQCKHCGTLKETKIQF